MFDFTSERIGERPIAIEQSERRPGGSPLNQEEFRLKRGRNCLNLGREVLSDLREMRIEDPNRLRLEALGIRIGTRLEPGTL